MHPGDEAHAGGVGVGSPHRDLHVAAGVTELLDIGAPVLGIRAGDDDRLQAPTQAFELGAQTLRFGEGGTEEPLGDTGSARRRGQLRRRR